MTDAYQQVLEHAAYFDHSDRGKVIVAGPDARSFLHNLCTNDVKNLRPASDWRQPAGGCEAFFATAQAKAVVFALIFCTEHDGQESFWLDLESGLAEKVFRHLDRYIISEQVELADRSAEFSQWHIAGPEAESVLTRAALGPPSRIRRWNRLGLPGWDVICPSADGKQVGEQLTDAGAIPAGAEIHNTLRIEAGIPIYGTDIDDNRFVVEVGRAKQSISYTKGCYLGQEPIVMARDRGHVNRTLMGLRVHSTQALPAGTKLLRQGKEVGEVTSSVVSPRFGTIALAYIRRGHQEPGTTVEITIGGGTGAAEVVTLPFVR